MPVIQCRSKSDGDSLKMKTNPTRRSLLVGPAILAAALAFAPTGASAQAFPQQDIHIICAFPAGSGADVLVRYFAEELRKKAGKPVIVENKTGAAGNIAAEYTARAKPDGYTIHIHAGNSTAANFWLFKKPPINPSKDLAAVAEVASVPLVLYVNASVPANTLGELVELIKNNPGKCFIK